MEEIGLYKESDLWEVRYEFVFQLYYLEMSQK